jgi:hypothetical protein
MLKWLKSLFSMLKPAGPPQTIRTFSANDRTITQDGVRVDADTIRIESTESRTVRLYDVKDPGVQQCVVTYRAEMKAEKVEGRAFLEMWCSFPGRGDFFSKGLHQPLSGTSDWARFEIPFYLKRGQTPDLIKLGLVVEGRGVVWMKNIELLSTPVSA